MRHTSQFTIVGTILKTEACVRDDLKLTGCDFAFAFALPDGGQVAVAVLHFNVVVLHFNVAVLHFNGSATDHGALLQACSLFLRTPFTVRTTFLIFYDIFMEEYTWEVKLPHTKEVWTETLK